MNKGAEICPDDCGLCNLHTSHTGLANVDLTNRCNLTCPVCFANANAAGYVYEPDFGRCARCCRRCATNTRSLPASCSFGRRADHLPAFPRCAAHGPRDGLLPPPGGHQRPQVHRPGIRPALQRGRAGHPLPAVRRRVRRHLPPHPRRGSVGKEAAVHRELPQAGLKIVFVPTIVKGLNDHQIGDIMRLALENIDCISGISFQPVAFTGRIARHELEPSASRSPISPTRSLSRPASPTRTRTGSRSPA